MTFAKALRSETGKILMNKTGRMVLRIAILLTRDRNTVDVLEKLQCLNLGEGVHGELRGS